MNSIHGDNVTNGRSLNISPPQQMKPRAESKVDQLKNATIPQEVAQPQLSANVENLNQTIANLLDELLVQYGEEPKETSNEARDIGLILEALESTKEKPLPKKEEPKVVVKEAHVEAPVAAPVRNTTIKSKIKSFWNDFQTKTKEKFPTLSKPSFTAFRTHLTALHDQFNTQGKEVVEIVKKHASTGLEVTKNQLDKEWEFEKEVATATLKQLKNVKGKIKEKIGKEKSETHETHASKQAKVTEEMRQLGLLFQDQETIKDALKNLFSMSFTIKSDSSKKLSFKNNQFLISESKHRENSPIKEGTSAQNAFSALLDSLSNNLSAQNSQSLIDVYELAYIAKTSQNIHLKNLFIGAAESPFQKIVDYLLSKEFQNSNEIKESEKAYFNNLYDQMKL